MDLEEEKKLIKSAQTDPLIFGKVYDHYYPMIFGYVLRRTANLDIAQDIVSDVFFKALKNLWKFQWRNIPFSFWLYKIATNEINQYFRKGKRSSFSLEILLEQGFEPSSLVSPETELLEAEEELKKYNDFIVCRKEIAKLDSKYQDVITLRFFEKKQIKEISGILSKSEGTIKSLLHRGLEKLRKVMVEETKVQPFASSDVLDNEGSSEYIINKQS